MSLVGALGTLLAAFTWAALGLWFAGIKGYVNHRNLWRQATAGLRARNRLLPPVVFGVGMFAHILLLGSLGATLTAGIVMFAVPALLVIDYGTDVFAFAIGACIGLFQAFIAGETEPDAENFMLPLSRVYQSKADDVSEWVGDGVHVPRRSLLTLGASGAGKSETLKHFVAQLQNNPNEPVVVFDMKTDYQDTLEEWGVPMVRLSSEGSTTEMGSPVAWNIFNELETEADADEIARSIFPSEKGEDNFFATAGRQLFAANLKYLSRELDNPTNADLVRYWQRATPEKMFENLTRDGHEDLTAAAAAIDPDAGRQQAGVFATAQQRVSDLFVGDFAAEGDFSIREYMQNPQGRVLVLDYPSRQAETIGPIYKFLIDDAIKHAMADSSRPAYFLLDEIEHMSVALSRLGELINVGRGNQCQAIISLQSVAQLYDTYGRERGQALLSGMATSVILRCADAESVEYARDTIGTHFTEYTHREDTEHLGGGVSITKNRETKLEEEHDFAEGEFYRFDPGECVVARQGEGWVHGRVRMLEQ